MWSIRSYCKCAQQIHVSWQWKHASRLARLLAELWAITCQSCVPFLALASIISCSLNWLFMHTVITLSLQCRQFTHHGNTKLGTDQINLLHYVLLRGSCMYGCRIPRGWAVINPCDKLGCSNYITVYSFHSICFADCNFLLRCQIMISYHRK